ncbi:MAG: restriction endonuclease subunit S [Verrucomicrobiota bacterium JB024]|nr:restriction endonuclease subunit S [Verrucomicrobiota bacterium JB024]
MMAQNRYPSRRLEELCEINIGKTPSRSKPAYWNGLHPWLSIADMNQGRYLRKTKEKITDAGVDASGIKIVPKRTLVLSYKLSIGKVGITEKEMYTNEAIASLPIKDQKVLDLNYLYWALKTIDLMGTSDRAAMGNTLNKAKLKEIRVPLPALEEQKRIAKILDAADALRAKRRESLAQLDVLLQSAFLDLFGDPVSNPKNWQARPLGEMMRIRRGGSPRPIDKYLGGSVNWIKIGDATRSGDDIYISSCAEKITEEGLSKTTFLEEGSFVFANSGVSLGFARILKVKGAIHDGWLAFDQFSDDLLNKLFFLKALNQITLHFRRMAPSGTQPNLNTGIMKSFIMIVPPIELQNQFAKFVEGVERQKALLRNHLEELDLLMGSLQRETFSMEL